MSRRKKSPKDEYLDGLRRLAFGDAKDAVRLLFLDDERIIETLPKLDLVNISEIKRPKGGGMEIKLFDRLKAMERLSELELQNRDEPISFYRALEQAAQNTGDALDGEDNE